MTDARSTEEAFEQQMDRYVRELEQWQQIKKPLELFESYEDHDKFTSLFRDEREFVASNHTVRSVWWNGTPDFPGDKIPLLSWHPMVHASLSGEEIWRQISAVLDTIDPETFEDLEQVAWYWQAEKTRWVWLTVHPPFSADPESDEGYIATHFFYRLHRDGDGTRWGTCEGAS